MLEPRIPKYQWGQRMRALVDLQNDGSYPDVSPEALLVKAGDTGEIVQVGLHTEANTVVYLVEFAGDRVVGCLEDEVSPA